MTTELDITRIDASRDLLGEGVLWDSTAHVLYWVDAVGNRVRRLDPASGIVTDWQMPSHVGSLAPTRDGERLIVALRDGIHELVLASGTLTPVAIPADLPVDSRLNDGKVDRQGRFLVGSIIDQPWSRVEGQKSAGKLYRLNLNRTLECLEDDLRLYNATCFNPRGDRLYCGDTPDNEIRVYDYEPVSGKLSNRRRLIDTKVVGSVPDGATVDADGCLWIALPQIAALGQFDPDGQLMRTVATPCPLPTCVSFGGAALDELYVTSLHNSGNGRLISNDPNSGHLFRIRGLDATGLAEVPFGG
jgi:L-arabinonolactonase